MSAGAGARALAAARGARIAGGLLTHGLLAWHLGRDGYGVLAIATSVLGLLRLIELVPPAALATFVPLLVGEGRGSAAGRVVRATWLAGCATALLVSLALWALHPALGSWFGSPAVADALLAVALWNLIPALRGPLDPELLLGLQAWRALLVARLLEQGGLVAAAGLTVWLHEDAAGYYELAVWAQLPFVLWSWSQLRLLAPLRGGEDGPVLRRYLRFCLPIAASQQLFKLYSSLGAPLLASFGSLAAAGAYRLAALIADLTAELLAAIPQARGPELAAARARGDVGTTYRAIVQQTSAASVAVALLLVAAAPVVGLLLGPAGFAAVVPLLVMFAPQVCLRTLSHPAALLALVQERPGIVTRANAGKLAIELGLGCLLVPKLGGVGLVAAHGIAAAAAAIWLHAAAGMLGAAAVDARTPLVIGALLVLAAVDLPLPAASIPIALLALAWWAMTRARPRGADVTFVCNSRSVGGVEQHLLALARACTHRGLQTELIAPRAAATRSWCERMQQAGVRRVWHASVEAPWDLLGWGRLGSVLAARDGLVHFHLNSMDDQAPGLLLARAAGRRPIVATLQLGRGDAPPVWSPKGIRRRSALPIPDRLLCVAAALRADVVARYGVEPERARTVRNGIEVEAFAPDAARRARVRRRLAVPDAQAVLLFSGRLTAVKGVAVLLGALRRIAAPPRVWIAGDGPERARLEAQAAGLPVTFLGWRDDVADLLRAADGLVLPSFHEGLPLAVLEGMAAGLPVLATAVAGTPEAVVHGETGFLVPPGDEAALAGAIEAWIKLGPAGRRKLGANGCARAQAEFRLDRQIDATLQTYVELGLRMPARSDEPMLQPQLAAT